MTRQVFLAAAHVTPAAYWTASPFCADFRPLIFRNLVFYGRSCILVAIFGALSLHPKIPFPVTRLEREVRPHLRP